MDLQPITREEFNAEQNYFMQCLKRADMHPTCTVKGITATEYAEPEPDTALLIIREIKSGFIIEVTGSCEDPIVYIMEGYFIGYIRGKYNKTFGNLYK